VLVTYRAELDHPVEALPEIGIALDENATLLADARRRVGELVETLGPAIDRPALRDFVDDYLVFAIRAWPDEAEPAAFLDQHRETFARAIEAERQELAPEQVERTLAGRMSYGRRDLALVDWNAAVLLDEEPDDVVAVLKHANVELLELRVLDLELDDLLDHADEHLAELSRKRFWPSFASPRLMQRFAVAQTDAAVMFEGVNNAIKLLGNQYLAQVYRLAADRLDLSEWQASVQRKLEAAESVYGKMSDTASIRRLETLEVIIIILIAASMVLPFLPIYGH